MQSSELTARAHAVRSLGYVHKLRLESHELIRDDLAAQTQALPPWALAWGSMVRKLAGAFLVLLLALWVTQFLN